MGPAGHTEESGCHTEKTLQGGDRISSECQQGRVGARAWRGQAGNGDEGGQAAMAGIRMEQEPSPVPHLGYWEPPLTHMAGRAYDLRTNTVYPPGATLPPREKSSQV